MVRSRMLALDLYIRDIVVFVMITAHALLSFRLTEANNVSKETLYVLTQLPYPVPNSAGQLPTWTEGVNIRLALNLAARQINKEPDLLPNHKLELVHINGGCDYIDVTVANFTEGVARLLTRKGRRCVGLIGPGCSGSTLSVARLLNRSDFSTVAIHGSGASIFSNRTIYPYLFGTLGSVEGFGELSVGLMEMTNWRKIAILFHDARLYHATMMREVVNAVLMRFSDIEIVYSSIVRLNNFYPLSDLRRSRARAIFVFTPTEHLRQILCLAYHLHMIYPAYQWVLPVESALDAVIPSSNNISFTYDGTLYRCSHDNFKAALNHSLLMNYRLHPIGLQKATKSIAGLNYTEYSELYEQEIEEYNSDETNPFRNISTTIWAAYFYDSLWALAIALHNVTQKYNVSLSDYQYEDESITKLIAEELYSVIFTGNSGPIYFNRDTGFVEREIDLTQVINYREELVAYSHAGNFTMVQDFEFIDDEFEIRNAAVYQGIAALYGFITSIQLLVVFALHILTVVYRNHKSVKASSPKLHHIAYIGIYLLVFALLLSSVSEHPTFSNQVQAAFCQVTWTWLLPISFTLSLGPVVVRTWRLYRIFMHYLNPGPFISNPVLITVICIMVAVDLVIAITWTSIDPFRLDELESTARHGDANFLVIRLGCRCDHFFVWFGVIMSYKVVLLTVLCALALLTRRIRNQSFTTASLRVFGYLSGIIFVLGFPTYYVIQFKSFDPNLELTLFSITLNLLLLAYIMCVFVPPVLLPLREKSKEYKLRRIKLEPVKLSDVQRKISTDSRDYLM